MSAADQPLAASGATVTILAKVYRLGATYRPRPGASGADRRLIAFLPSGTDGDQGGATDGQVVYSSGGSSHSCAASAWVAWAGAVR